MRRIEIVVLGLAFVLARGVGVEAATVYVDASNTAGPWDGTQANPFNKIQDGIDAVVDGNTVLVADGTYTGSGNTNLNLKGKAITVTSENGAASAIIDCENDFGRVRFENGEDSTTIFTGFTIKNMYAGTCVIHCKNSAPTISANIIENCGGGSCCYPSSQGAIYCENSSGVIRNNVITNVSFAYGGGIRCVGSSSPNISGNTITGNYSGFGGGGICCCGSSPTIENNTITENSCVLGSGIYVDASSPNIINNIIARNCYIHYLGDAWPKGAGIYCVNNSSPNIINNTIVENSTSISTGKGGGIYCSDSSPTILNTILWGNTADAGGNQIYISGSSSVTVKYSDVQGGQGGIIKENGTLTYENNINANPLFTDKFGSGDYYLDVGSPCLGSATGEGAPSTDKDGRSRSLGEGYDMGCYEQVDGNTLPVELSSFIATASVDGVTIHWRTESEVDNLGFHLYRALQENGPYERITSELIPGAGSTTTEQTYSFTDRNVITGITYWYKLEDVAFDGMRTMHGPIAVTPQVKEEVVAARPDAYALSPCVPNPFNPITTIRYQLPEPGDVSLTIYDLLGQEVRVLVSERQPVGWYRVRWDGRDEAGQLVSSGVYLYRLDVEEEFLQTRKLTVVR